MACAAPHVTMRVASHVAFLPAEQGAGRQDPLGKTDVL